MKVSEVIGGRLPALSFEFFPPKTPEQEETLYATLAQLIRFKPDFVSVTYGAMGNNRERTFYWVREIKEKFFIDPLVHLTCINATRTSIRQQLDELASMGINNILALRGDPPAEAGDFSPPRDGFRFAKELIAFIKAARPEFCVGAAGFPEGHPGAASAAADIQYLKQKVDAGAEFVISQLFFDNRYFLDYTARCRSEGIEVPIIPWIMPITSLKQIKKMTEICGATIPAALLRKLEMNAEDKRAIEQIGIEQAVAQCRELQGAGVPGLHFFVMNQAGPISEVLKALGR